MLPVLLCQMCCGFVYPSYQMGLKNAANELSGYAISSFINLISLARKPPTTLPLGEKHNFQSTSFGESKPLGSKNCQFANSRSVVTCCNRKFPEVCSAATKRCDGEAPIDAIGVSSDCMRWMEKCSWP